MKKLLFAAIALAGFAAIAPDAQAGHRERYIRYYDHCGRPVYGYIYRDDCYYDRPRVYYRRPVRTYYYSNYYDDCAPRYRYYRSSPRVSFHFGF